jgi:hypothetical protein
MLAGEFRALADEIRFNGGIADAIDELGARALTLGGEGYATLPLTLGLDGRVSVEALDEYLVAAVNESATPRR